MYLTVGILGLIAIIYSAIAGRVEKSVLTGPIIFLLLGVILGPSVTGALQLDLNADGVKVLAEFTLALVLFTDASTTNLFQLNRNRGIPLRMLLIGMPLVIGLGYLAGLWCFPGLHALELAILAVILAPTDAALGKSVIENKEIPESIRTSLNAESGLNDGLAVPVLFLLLGIAGGMLEGGWGSLAVELLVEELGIGAVVGIGVVLTSSWVHRVCFKRGWMTSAWMPVPVLATAIAAFAIAQFLHGSGFIACFVGGLTYNKLGSEHKAQLLNATQGISELMSMITWTVFGAIIVPLAIPLFTWQVVVYALLSLTVVRMLPIGLSLIGGPVNLPANLFLGWFGPRGLASIVFAVIVIGKGLENQEMIVFAAVATVIFSVFAHGLTATALGRWLGPRMKVTNQNTG